MATLTIRDLDDGLKAQLRLRAARNGRSMEAEVRALLREALTESGTGLGDRIHARFAAHGGVDLPIPPRTELPRAADLPA